MTESRSIKGTNWCDISLESTHLVFHNKQKRICRIPICKISNSSAHKNDVVIDI